MGVRYRKSISVGKGVKFNIGKRSTGVSIGGRHGGVSINSRTGVTGRVFAPGTGVSYTHRFKTGGGAASGVSASGSLRDRSEAVPGAAMPQRVPAAGGSLRALPPLLFAFMALSGLLCLVSPYWYIAPLLAVIFAEAWRRKAEDGGKPYFVRWWGIVALIISTVFFIIGLTRMK